MTMFERNLDALRETLRGPVARHVVGVFNAEGFVVKALDVSPPRSVAELDCAVSELCGFLGDSVAANDLTVVSITGVDPSGSQPKSTADKVAAFEERLRSAAVRAGATFSVCQERSLPSAEAAPLARAVAGGAC